MKLLGIGFRTMEDLLKTADVSKKLKVPKSTIYAWAKQDKIPHRKIHGTLRFIPEEIERWIESFRTTSTNPNLPKNLGLTSNSAVDSLIARAQREAYNSHTGKPGQNRALKEKEENNGAL